MTMSAASGQATKPPTGVPTFTKDVAPILYKNCTGCHRPGEIAPMSLLTYKDARPWAKSIATQVGEGTMPPWHADPKPRRVPQRPPPDRRRTSHDAELGEQRRARRQSRATLPPQPKLRPTAGRSAQPDAIFCDARGLPGAARTDSSSTVLRECRPTSPKTSGCRRSRCRPGDPRGAASRDRLRAPPAPQPRAARAGRCSRPRAGHGHSARDMEIRLARPADDAAASNASRARAFPAPQRDRRAVGGFAPGTSSFAFRPAPRCCFRPASTLVLQMHYTTNGKAATDRTRIGSSSRSSRRRREMRLGSLSTAVHDSGRRRRSRVDAEMTIGAGRDAVEHAAAHARARQELGLRRRPIPDGRTEMLLSVPKYDFNWQTDYVFKQPLKLPKGTKIRAVAHYDNSTANKSNPDPTEGRAVGRSDLGRDDVHGVRLLHRRRHARRGRHAAAQPRRAVAAAFGRNGHPNVAHLPRALADLLAVALIASLRHRRARSRSRPRSRGIARSPRSSRPAARDATRAADPRTDPADDLRRGAPVGGLRSKRKCSRGGCPKWKAARGYGDFANDPSLSPFEIALMAAWADGGAPEIGDRDKAPGATARTRFRSRPLSARLRRTPGNEARLWGSAADRPAACGEAAAREGIVRRDCRRC